MIIPISKNCDYTIPAPMPDFKAMAATENPTFWEYLHYTILPTDIRVLKQIYDILWAMAEDMTVNDFSRPAMIKRLQENYKGRLPDEITLDDSIENFNNYMETRGILVPSEKEFIAEFQQFAREAMKKYHPHMANHAPVIGHICFDVFHDYLEVKRFFRTNFLEDDIIKKTEKYSLGYGCIDYIISKGLNLYRDHGMISYTGS
ncbi:MAG: hypothetical protein OEZ13_04340 [Spirochaetia bacterium]|nr:hypothetical protein [Spirochaetia bacterium]